MTRNHLPRSRTFRRSLMDERHPSPSTSSVRLQKVLRDSSGISRRRAEELIARRKVEVNGKAAALGDKADPLTDRIVVNGEPLPKPSRRRERTTVLLYKPSGCVTTRNDPHGRKTVFDFLPMKCRKLFPVGRLDYATEGLLLLTDDGDLAYRLTHPKFEVEKEYIVTINKPLGPADEKRMTEGVHTETITTAPTKLHLRDSSRTVWNLTVHEGQNREIRRVFEALGYQVIHLKRIRLGSLTIRNMHRGTWRVMTPAETAELESTDSSTKRRDDFMM